MNYVFLNGEIIEKKDAKISPFDHGFLYGDAVYETLLLENKKVYFFEDHWFRMKKSLTSLGIILPKYCATKEKMQDIMREVIEKNNVPRARVRITVSRGENNFDFSSSPYPTILISLSSFPKYPEKIFSQGIAISTFTQSRPTPEIKSTNFIASILGRRTLLGTKNFEAVFLSPQGFIREGTVSNIWGIRGKILYIAPRKSVLPGTLQASIEKIFLEKGYKIQEKNFSVEKIFSDFDELFLSNSLVGVVPIREIDGKVFRKTFPIFQKFFGSGSSGITLHGDLLKVSSDPWNDTFFSDENDY